MQNSTQPNTKQTCPATIFPAGGYSGQFRSTVDGPLFSAIDNTNTINFAIQDGFPVYQAHTATQNMTIEIEDLHSICDGTWHSFAISVTEQGTEVFIDGYFAFAGTSPLFISEATTENTATGPQVRNFTVHERPISPEQAVSLAQAPEPLTQFAACYLADYDVQTLAELRTGSLRARFRVRGVGQGGVIVAAAGGGREQLRLSVDEGGISYEVAGRADTWRKFRATGNWADGDWHEVVVRAYGGAIDLYVDGFRESHTPGQAFFAAIEQLDTVVIGQDTKGQRLFGEAQRAEVYGFALTDGQIKRLAHVSPLRTIAIFDRGYRNSISYRIPSLLTLPSGTVVAGADQRTTIANDSPNDINFVVRRSLDGGQHWEDLQTILDYPGEGADGASVIDSCSVYDREEKKIVLLIDHFPGGIGQPNNELGVGVDEKGNLLLHDAEGAQYTLHNDGSVTDSEGKKTEYLVDPDGTVHYGDKSGGNIYLKDGVSPNQTLLTARTSFLLQIESTDEGATWSTPRHLNHQVKEDWMRFMGTSPGTGIQLETGSHRGRIVMPVYYNGDHPKRFSASVIYSDDHGQNWKRAQGPNDGRQWNGEILDSRTFTDDEASTHESTVVELKDGTLLLLMRNQNSSGRVAVSASHDGGETWEDPIFHPQLPEIFSQPNAITIPSNDALDWVVFANASQLLPFRGNGVLRISSDGGNTWNSRTFNPGHYVYQSMTLLPSGELGLLWENEWQGLYFTIIPFSWFGLKELPKL